MNNCFFWFSYKRLFFAAVFQFSRETDNRSQNGKLNSFLLYSFITIRFPSTPKKEKETEKFNLSLFFRKWYLVLFFHGRVHHSISRRLAFVITRFWLFFPSFYSCKAGTSHKLIDKKRTKAKLCKFAKNLLFDKHPNDKNTARKKAEKLKKKQKL